MLVLVCTICGTFLITQVPAVTPMMTMTIRSTATRLRVKRCHGCSKNQATVSVIGNRATPAINVQRTALLVMPNIRQYDVGNLDKQPEYDDVSHSRTNYVTSLQLSEEILQARHRVSPLS